MAETASHAESLAFLKKTDENGLSVYSQLTDVLAQILVSKPADALKAFESISQQVKAGQFSAAAATRVSPMPTEVSAEESAGAAQDVALFKVRSAFGPCCLRRPSPACHRCRPLIPAPHLPCAAEQ
jgi:hypothetical protein